MKLNRRKLRELINEAIYGSNYYKWPRDPSMHVTPQIRKKTSQLTTSDSEEDRRAGYQLASSLQQDELVFPNDNSAPYEELPYKGSDYVDDINDFNNKAFSRRIGEIGNYLTSSDFSILNSIVGKELNYVLAGWDGPVFYLAKDNRSQPYAIEPEDLNNMVIRVAAKKKEITQSDIDDHMGMDSEVDARHKVVTAIMNIANKTYVSRYDVEDCGIGEQNLTHGQSPAGNFPPVVFWEDSYHFLFERGKLVIL